MTSPVFDSPTARVSGICAITWEGNRLRLLDQRHLPLREAHVTCHDAAETAAAIRDMVVRGAPAIGIVAAYGMVLAAQRGDNLVEAEKILAAARPTAVNLRWALDRVGHLWRNGGGTASLLLEAQALHAEDIEQNFAMAAIGAALIEPGSAVLTHCNTGALATGGHGTALGVIRTAWAEGRVKRIFHTETRPWLQGARLTAWELKRDGIPATMIADNAAAHLMRTHKLDWVIVGADRIAANGDVANKIGTYQLAVSARAHGVRFMVVAPSGTFDLSVSDGYSIPIEHRSPSELSCFGSCEVAPADIQAFNPVFDITPATLIDAIICERGVIEQPQKEAIAQVLARVGK